MIKKYEYYVVVSTDYGTFMAHVEERLNAGWKLAGGVCENGDESSGYWSQAMTLTNHFVEEEVKIGKGNRVNKESER